MTASQILAAKKPGDIFSNDPAKAKQEYRDLIKEWHPDATKRDTNDILKIITDMYEKADEMFKAGTWEESNRIRIPLDNGKALALSFLHQADFELGTMYVGNKSVIYVVSADKKKYVDQMVKTVNGLKYKDDKMREEFSRYFPFSILASGVLKATDGRHILTLAKTEDVFPMKLVIEHFGGHLPDRHVAWIMSRLLNISCYFNYSGTVHNGITIDNCFMSPSLHSVLLLGGWWYATEINKPMVGVPAEVFEVMSVAAKSRKISSNMTDLESIKLIGRTLLGQPNCRLLAASDLAPKPFIEFLISGSKESSIEEFKKWGKALDAAYGKRTFVPLDVTKEQIYHL